MLRRCACSLLMSVLLLLASLNASNLLAAQPPAAAAPVRTPGEPEKRSAEEAIRQALNKNVSLSYQEVPLRNVAQDLESKLGVPLRFDAAALKEAGVDEDVSITFSVSNVSARSAICLLLRRLQLTAISRNEVLLITSFAVAESALVTKVYDATDFANSDAADDDQQELKELVDVITTCVGTNTWVENGGYGTICRFTSPGIRALVVSQNQEVLAQIDDLLQQLRTVRHAATAGRKASSEPATRHSDSKASQLRPKDHHAAKIPVAEQAVRQALAKPLTVYFRATPLLDAIHKLTKLASVPIIFDENPDSREAAAGATVTLDASGRTLRAILDELVQPLHLAWTYHAESLLITSPAAAEGDSMQSTRVYSLAGFPAYKNRRSEAIPDYKKMIDTIENAVASKSWQENGGRGTIAAFHKPGIHGIVVSQTWHNHLEIESLLDRLGQIRARGLTADDIRNLPAEPEPAESPGADQPSKPLEADARRDAIVAANNQFAIDLHKTLDGDNRFFSPSSIATAMAMVYTGAHGASAEEIAKVLHFTVPQEEIAPAFQSLLATLPVANRPGCTFTSANRLWSQQGYGFLAPFLTTTHDRFGADLVEVDFSRPAAVCNRMNAWADQQTAGRIKQIVEPSFITPQSRFVLTNAVYFKGRWAEPFKVSATRTAPFFTGEERVDVPLMHQEARCRYGSFGNLKVLEKSYRGGEFAMMILLPSKDPQALLDLEQSLSAEKVVEWSSKLRRQMVDIALPKFKLEKSVPLRRALTALGMARVFDPRKADLSGINGGKEPLWLDWLLQRAFVSVDEEGTTAAAVTAMGGAGSMEPQIAIFRADHPFLFLIRDTRTGCIFFLGRLVRPENL